MKLESVTSGLSLVRLPPLRSTSTSVKNWKPVLVVYRGLGMGRPSLSTHGTSGRHAAAARDNSVEGKGQAGRIEGCRMNRIGERGRERRTG